MTFTNMAEVIRANSELGHHYFDKSTLNFFGSRIHGTLYGGRFFVTSERDRVYTTEAAWSGERRFTVRMAQPDGSIITVGDFGQYATRAAAHAAAKGF